MHNVNARLIFNLLPVRPSVCPFVLSYGARLIGFLDRRRPPAQHNIILGMMRCTAGNIIIALLQRNDNVYVRNNVYRDDKLHGKYRVVFYDRAPAI